MKSFDRALCGAIGKNRRAIEKMKSRIRNSMEFHQGRGTDDWPKWVAMQEELSAMEARDEELTAQLKTHRQIRKEKKDA